MIHISYNDSNYTTFFPKIAKAFGAPFEQNRIELPKESGKGYLELMALGDNHYAAINHFTLNDDVKFCRQKGIEPFFILHFDEIKSKKELTIQLDGEMINIKGNTMTTAMLTGSMFDLCYVLPAETSKRSVNVILTKEWIKEYLELEHADDAYKTFFSLRKENLNQEPFNTEYRTYFDHVFDTPPGKPLRELHIRNAIMMLIEVYFSRLYRKIKSIKDSPISQMKNADMIKLMEVESILVKDFSKTPPTIVDLAAYTSMSVSKLKSAFKRVYGTGIYEYYQKSRMKKARTLLASEGYTIKEVGLKMGYTNLSNFSLAFKKEFGVLPSQLQ